MVSSRFRRLAAATCIGMLLVLLAGALVTNTGSGRGCGDDWPLCNGKFIPAYTVESLIEYSHRLVTGVVGLLVLASFIAAYQLYRRNGYREALWYAAGSGFFTVLQALLGAAAVMWPQSPPVMALHFGFSIMAFACTMLLWVWAVRMNKNGAAAEAVIKVPRSVYIWCLSIIVYCYFVIYLGAFIRHTESAGGCIGWPLCNGEVIPKLEGVTGLVFAHRVAAFILMVLVAYLTYHVHKACRTNAELKRSAMIVLALIIIQVLSGGLLTSTITNEDAFVFTSMLHNLIISLFFGFLVDLTIRAGKWRERKN
ncbi:heme A synthase [Paenibacillus sp. GCM10027626]|uniref:COX15/CtaA family protein n=1 Tax=Paenibacillus sp. GCM10027626 TaxID=3273411 RepID=UPI0036330615